MSKALAVFLAVLAALVVGVAGCGSSSDENEESSESTAAITKAEFVKQGNAICTAGNEEIEEQFEEFGKEQNLSQNQRPTTAQLTEAAETIIVPAVKKEVSELEALPTPEGDEEQVEAIFTAANQGIETVEEEPTAIEDENGGAFAEANKLAREYGLTTCGEEGEEEGGEGEGGEGGSED